MEEGEIEIKSIALMYVVKRCNTNKLKFLLPLLASIQKVFSGQRQLLDSLKNNDFLEMVTCCAHRIIGSVHRGICCRIYRNTDWLEIRNLLSSNGRG